MSRNMDCTVKEEGISRRDFLKVSLGTGVFLLAAGSVSSILASAGCAAAPTADFIITSSLDFNHSHNVTIPGADVDKPVDATLTSDGATHQHPLKCKKADFEAIKKGQEITLTMDSAGTTPHTHTCKIKKPA